MQFRDPIDWEAAVLVPLGFRPSSLPWRVTVKAIYGTPLTDDELVIFRRLSGGVDPPVGGSKRVLLVYGRRAGKSSGAGRLCFFEAAVRDHYRHLEPGQTGVAGVVAQDLDGAQHVVDYARGVAEIPALKRKYIADIKKESVEFKNGIVIRSITASESAVRGHTQIVSIGDELASWDHVGPDEDRKVMTALTPSLLHGASAPPRRFIGLTSAGYRKGFAWDIYDRYYGKPGAPWLVLSAPTTLFRPDISDADIEADCAGDRSLRAREYDSEWGDLTASSFFLGAEIQACVTKTPAGKPREGVRYHVAIDPSFERDNFAIAVACSTLELVDPKDVQRKRERRTEIVHVDAWRPHPGVPLPLRVVADRVAAVCNRYGVDRVYSDQHAAAPMADALREARWRIKLVKRPWHSGNDDTSKAARFSAVREAMAARTLTLPDVPELLRELASITAKPLPNGGIKIEGSGRNDDRAMAAVLAASEALLGSPSYAADTLRPYERDALRTQFDRLGAFICGV